MKNLNKYGDNVDLETICFEDVLDMTREGDFNNKLKYDYRHRLSKDHIFDEEKSVKWNREEVRKYNADIESNQLKYALEDNKSNNFFIDCLKAAILNDTSLPKEKIDIIYDRAYSEEHSGGYESIIYEVINLCDFVNAILK